MTTQLNTPRKYPEIDWTKNEYIEEAIAMLEAEIDYDPTPNDPGEPPITADEMHTAAWQQHQELHK